MLTKLLRKTSPFKWTKKQLRRFDKLKFALTQAAILIQLESRKDYVVYSNASNTDLSCVLMQDDKVVAYALR